METFLKDVRVTLRAFRRAPGFPLTAIATLALGIGATTAIFTALSAVLLKPLPTLIRRTCTACEPPSQTGASPPVCCRAGRSIG